MTHAAMEVPSEDELAELPLDVSRSDEPWIISVVARAEDDSTAQLMWDQIASSATVWWRGPGGRQLLRMEREKVRRVAIHEARGQLIFEISSESSDLAGRLVVTIGAEVTVTDALLEI